MTARHRVFLGIDIPDEARHRLAAQFERAVKQRLIPGKRVPVENWHITLRFIGSATEVEQERILQGLDEVAKGPAFPVELGGLGAFPKPSKAGVVWLGVQLGAGRLADLAALCEQAVVDAGLPQEDRPFHGHLTLSRARPPVDVRQTIGEVEVTARFEVNAVTLFRSIPQNRKPMRYEVVDRVPLG